MATFGAPYAPSERRLPTRIGSYRIVRLLDTGTTSEILLARQEGPCEFQRVVVLKVLTPALRGDPISLRMFADEAAAYARLSHPAVARLYDFLHADGEYALVLEHVDGLPLNALRSEMKRRGERLSDEAILFLGSRLFGALAAAHAARDAASGEFAPVVHADVNPSNVIVPWDGYAKVVDLGSTRARRPVDAISHDAGGSYLAPEQARGEPATTRSDIYSACLVLWELFTDRRAIPNGRMSHAELLETSASPHLPSFAALRPDLPRLVQDVVVRGLQPNPDRRDVSAEDVCAVLNATTDLPRGRSALAESLGRARLVRIHTDQLETTPNLPRAVVATEPSIEVAHSVLLSDRPVVLADPLAPPSSGVRESPPWPVLTGAAVGLACLVAIVLAQSRRAHETVETATAHAAASTATNAPASPSAADAPPAITAAPAIPTSGATPTVVDPPVRATITVPRSHAGHRVWIDHAIVGQAPGAFQVSCGRHTVRVGSRGNLLRVDVACGDDFTVP